jgi:glycosyltransferase involved in cell wall biosynthesis
VPVWIEPGGTLVTDRYRPAAVQPSLAARARWALAPLRWPDVLSLRARLKAAAVRVGRVARGPLRCDRTLPTRAPDGYLDSAPGPTSVPLYAGTHPVTGDQLITCDLFELGDLGYADPIQLGHAVAAAHLTGRRGCERHTIPWAARLGKRVRTPAALVPEWPLGVIDGTTPPDQVPTTLWGWALGPVGRVARVEIELNGRPCGPARIGLARPDVARVLGLDDAHTSGFEFAVLPSHLLDADFVDGRVRLEVGATVHGYDGERCRLEPVVLDLAGPERTEPLEEMRAVELRERAARSVRPPPRVAPQAHNLLVFSHNLGLGGAQLYLVELLEQLRRRNGFHATVIALGDGPLRERLELLGIPVHVAGEIALQSAELYEARVAELAAWAAAQDHFDVAIVNSLCAFPGVDVASLLGIPSLFAVHESYELDEFWGQAYAADFAGSYVRRRARALLREADAVIFEADATRRLYEPYANGGGHHLALPYAIEIGALASFKSAHDRDEIRERLGFSPDERVVLCLGTAEPRKAQSMLIDAFQRVAGDHPDAVLALVGLREDVYSDALRVRATSSRLGRQIRLVSLSAEPLLWHLAADLLVCASDVESLPRVILEAMVFEVPVISTAVYGVADLIDDGRTGYLCQPRDGAALAGALGRALSASDAERRAMGRAAAEVIRRDHDPDVYAIRVAALLEEIAQRRQSVPASGGDMLAA